MRRSIRVAAAVGALGVGMLSPAHAVGTASWNQVCSQAGLGIATFSTCASAVVNVTAGGNVTIKLWNLAGHNGTWNGAVFTAVGLENMVPSDYNVVLRNLSVKLPNGSNYAGWQIADQGGGIPGPSIALGAKHPGANDGIVSPFYPGTLGSRVQTPWTNLGGVGYVEFSFQLGTFCPPGNPTCRNNQQTSTFTGLDFDPNNVKLGLHAQSGPTGESTGYACLAVGDPLCPETVVPEPATMVLMASGLVGMAGVTILRRRRRKV